MKLSYALPALLALISLASPPLVSASSPTPAELAARLKQSAATSSLYDPALKPWHLKLAVQLYDPAGKPSETAAIEEWWAGPALYRIDYSSPSYSATEVHNQQGDFFSSKTAEPPYLLEQALRHVVHPMPTEKEITEAVPDERNMTFGKLPLACVMLDQPIKMVAYPPIGLFPTYCLDPKTDTLRISYEFGTELTVRNHLATFQGRTIALDTETQMANVQAISEHLEKLEALTSNFSFDPSADLEKASALPTTVPDGVMAGRRLRGEAPIYPAAAKGRHATGTVEMQAIIGTDGHVHALKLVSIPDPDLAMAALAAVRTWVYEPFRLNGVPVSVVTTVKVNFNLSH